MENKDPKIFQVPIFTCYILRWRRYFLEYELRLIDSTASLSTEAVQAA